MASVAALSILRSTRRHRPGGTHAAQHHAGRLPAHHQADPRARPNGAREQQGHHLHRRRLHRIDLRRGVRPSRPTGRRAVVAGRTAGRPGGHVHVEQPDPPRGLPGHPVHGCGAAHAEHPPVPRATRVRDQPRRGQGHHHRRVHRAAAGPGARSTHHGAAHHREGLSRCAHLGRAGPRRRPARLRHPHRCSSGWLRVPRHRREAGHGHVLHERHDG